MTTLPRGILVPLLTPFTADGQVDLAMVKALTRLYADAGVHGLFVNGSAGQGPAMSPEQRAAALEAVIEALAERSTYVIAHIGTVDAFSGRQLAEHARRTGADAIAIVPPYYYSDHSEYEVTRHYAEVSGGAPELPVVIYDNPQYSGIKMPADRVARMKKDVPQIEGIKASFAGLEYMLLYLWEIGPDFRVYSSSMHYVLGGTPLGLAGAINPPLSPFPEFCMDVWRAVEEKRWDDACRLQAQAVTLRNLLGPYLKEFGRSVYQELMRLRGYPVVRYPIWTTKQMTPDQVAVLGRQLVEAGLGDYITV